MPRKRIIDPEFWSDEEIGQWSYPARLFYIGLWNFADDEGRFKAHNSLLKSQIFPYDNSMNIDKLKKELNHKIQWYEVEGSQYGFIRNFLKYQRIDRPTPSKLPMPGQLADNSSSNRGSLAPNISKDNISKVNIREVNIYVDFEQSTLIAWNSFCDKFPVLSKLQEITPKRREKLKKRFEQSSFQEFGAILQAVSEQQFLLGANNRKWKVGFDWLIENDTNFVKVLERKYLDTSVETSEDIRKKLKLPGA